MGFDLYGKKDSCCLNWSDWRETFELAIENGWKPAGTKPPDEETTKKLYGCDSQMVDNWNGGYFSNDFQLVTAEDATNMANALDRSLEFNVTNDAEWLRKFIRFARSGAFIIG
tara:strand:- start:1664 stop:2002 length:339 start_codon:yes stop_codon:yes gene_type:complete